VERAGASRLGRRFGTVCRYDGPHGQAESGVDITFNTKIGQPSGLNWAEVVHYQDGANGVMMGERPGDRVKVCFLHGPEADEVCNPQKDGRGRWFSVYDDRQRASYTGMNSEHGCGGA